MVVAALVGQFAPASRGVFRRTAANPSDNSYSAPPPPHATPSIVTSASPSRRSIIHDISERSLQSILTQDAEHSTRKRVHFHHSYRESSSLAPSSQPQTPQPSKSPYRFKKRFRAMSALTSIASDFDIVTDWIFYYMTIQNERELEKSGENLIPPIITNLLLTFCITGTLSWLMLATDGRVVAPILRRLGIRGISTGAMLLFCVLFEDLPQVVLTFLVEDYYDDTGGDASQLSGYAVMNLMTSLYDTLIKFAEAYDERHDVIETGLWVKGSFRGHERTVNAVVAVSLENIPNLGGSDMNMSLSQSIYFEPGPLPPPLFLTASKDKTARLWMLDGEETPNYFPTAQKQWRFSCKKSTKNNGTTIRTYSDHTDSVTSIAILGENLSYANLHYDHGGPFKVLDDCDEQNVFFVTGSLDGTAKLWHLTSLNSIRTFAHPDVVVDADLSSPSFSELVIDRTKSALSHMSRGNRSSDGSAVMAVVCLDDVSGTEFVCGYRDSTIRLWDAWSGECLCVYRGHEKVVHSLCALGDGYRIISGSKDKTIKVWDTSPVMTSGNTSMSSISFAESGESSFNVGALRNSFNHNRGKSSMNNSFGLVAVSESESESEEQSNTSIENGECTMTFIGHTGAVLSVATLEVRKSIVSGSSDRTARLWSIDTGLCIRIFHGHLDAVNSVSALDETMILTASRDRTVKLWDANPGGGRDGCLRTYTDHKNEVTCVTNCQDGETFITGSRDCTAKMWNVTTATLPPSLQAAIEEHGGLFGTTIT